MSKAATVRDARLRRDAPYQLRHDRSKARAWDARRRAPEDLRDAVRIVRSAWVAETPDRMTLRVNSLGDDGNPRFAPEAEAFIFGRPDAVEYDEPGAIIRYRLLPFRATLAIFTRGDDKMRHQAALVRRITAGEQGPMDAAMAEGVPSWCAKDVAEQTLRVFLTVMSEVAVDDRALV